MRAVEEDAATVEGGEPYQGGPVGGDDAEVALAAAQRPEQLGMTIGVDRAQSAVGGDHIDAQHAVRGQAEPAAQDAEATAESEPGGSGRSGRALDGREAVASGGRGDIAHPGPGSDGSGRVARIDGDPRQAAGVDQQGAIGVGDRPVTGGVNPDGQTEAGSPPHGGHHIIGGAGAYHQGWPQADREVPGRDLLLVRVLAGDTHGALAGGPQAGQLAGGEGVVGRDGHRGTPGMLAGSGEDGGMRSARCPARSASASCAGG